MTNPNFEPQSQPQTPYRLLTAAAVAASLAISGCASQEQPQETTQLNPNEITLTAAKLPQGECSLRFVRPNAYLKEQKASALSKDLGLLSMLNSKSKKAKFGDIATASGIIYDSYKDPVYAQAINKTNQSIRKGKKVTVKQLKATKTDKLTFCEDRNHISKKDSRNHYHRTVATGQYLIRELGKKYTKQGSTLAERTLEKASQSFEALKNDFQEAIK